MNEEIGGLFLQICRGRLERNTSKLLDCLSSLPEEEIWKRPNSHSNSIGNLILHLCGNARQWIISGIGGPKDVRQRVQEFSRDAFYPKAELEEMVRTTVREADQTLADFGPQLLVTERTIQGFRVSCLEAIFSCVEHWSHHVGQVLYITKVVLDQDLGMTRLTSEGFNPNGGH